MQRFKRTIRFLPPRSPRSVLYAAMGCAALAMQPAVASAQECTTATDPCHDGAPPSFVNETGIDPYGKITAAVTLTDAEYHLSYTGTDYDRMWINGVLVATFRQSLEPVSTSKTYRSVAIDPVPAIVGANTIRFYSCDTEGNCDTAEWTLDYKGPPPPPTPPGSLVDVEGTHPGFVPARHWAFSASYATPAYVSRDLPRSVGLHYSSEAVAPRTLVRVWTSTSGDIMPVSCTVWLMRADGTRVPLIGGGTERSAPCPKANTDRPEIILETDESATATGAYTYTVVLRRGWPDGTSSEATKPVRRLVVNDVASPYGSGWILAGVQRLHVQNDGILITNGDGTASFFKSDANWVEMASASSSDWEIGGVADMTADGKADIVWRNRATGQNGVWVMNGTSYSHWVELTGSGGDWQIGGVADMTADGKPDIVWQNRVTRQTGVWVMNGTSYSHWVEMQQAASSDWQIGGVADMTADGKPDIVWQNRATRQTGVWVMNGTSYSHWVEKQQAPSSDWQIGGVADMTADGTPNLVWQNRVTRQTASSVMTSGTGWTTPVGDFTNLTYNGSEYHRQYPDKSVAVFSSAGLLSSYRDRLGNWTVYYSGLNEKGVPVIRHIQDPAGKVINLTYHGAGSSYTGKLATVEDPAGRITRFGYGDGWENLTDIQEADGRAGGKYAYDGGHRITSSTDVSGATTQYAYDANRRLQSVTSPAVTLADGRVVAPTRTFTSTPDSLVVRDERSILASISGIDVYGNAQRIETRDSVVQTFRHDAHGRLTYSARTVRGVASGTPVWYTYQAATPFLSTEQTPDAVTEYYRNADPVLVDSIGTTRGTGTVLRNFISGTPARIDSTSTRLPDDTWGTTRYTYDGIGRLTVVRDAQFHPTSFKYVPDGMQNLLSSYAKEVTVAHTHDAAGRVIGTKSSTQDLVTGAVTVHQSTSTAYDAVNRVLSQTGPTGTVRYSRDFPGRATTVTDQKGQTFTTRYNAAGWVVSGTDPRGRTQTVGYDQWGNPTVGTNRRGQTIQTTYDDLDRPLTVRSADASITYAYDPNHRWTAVANGSSVDTVFADDKGRTTREVSVHNSRRHEVTYVHPEGFGVITSMTVKLAGQTTGQTTRWWAGHSGGLTYIGAFDEGNNPAVLTHDNEGKPTSQSHRTTGLLVTQEYDHHDRLDAQFTNYAAVNKHSRMAYTPDLFGRIKTAVLPDFYNRRELAYDSAGRLGRYVDDNGSTVVRSAVYTYDAVGNPTNRGAVVETGNRVMQLDGAAFTYDEDGNTLTKGDRTFTWNTLGQLSTVSDALGKHVWYYYDGMGRRVRRVTRHPDGRHVETQYVYAMDHLVAELDGAGNPIREFAYYPGTDRPYAMRRAGKTYKFVQDGSGDVVALVDGGNNPAYSYKYNPWGRMWYDLWNGDTTQPLRYRAREYDLDTGLYQNRARWYDPAVGRFLSEDPIGIAGGLNVYVYAGNDPVNYSDPTGLLKDCPSNRTKGNDYNTECTPILLPMVKGILRPDGNAWLSAHCYFCLPQLASLFGHGPRYNRGSLPELPSVDTDIEISYNVFSPNTIGPTPPWNVALWETRQMDCNRFRRSALRWTIFEVVGAVGDYGTKSVVPLGSGEVATALGGSYADQARDMANTVCATVPRW